MKLVDEVALQGADELLGIARARLSRNPRSAAELGRSVFEIFAELWPAGEHVDPSTYLITIDHDIDKMPSDLLEDLTAALIRRAKELRNSDHAAGSATQLVANWLKLRIVEIRSDPNFRDAARHLKGEHKELFKQVLSARAAQDTELAS